MIMKTLQYYNVICLIYQCLIFYAIVLSIHVQQGVQDKFRFSTFCFQYPTYLVQFVLSVLLEPKSKGSYEILTEVRERERERERELYH